MRLIQKFSYLFLILVAFSIYALPSSFSKKRSKPLVVVSIPPYKYYVEMLTRGTVDIQVAIPEGYDPHIFEASPKQVEVLEGADLWIGVGEPFEGQMIQFLKHNNPNLQVLNLKQEIPLLSYKESSEELNICGTTSHHTQYDNHIWMSPKLGKIQAKAITQTLEKMYPKYKKVYEIGLKNLWDALDDLDTQITQILEPFQGDAILVSHPSFGYFCHEYHLKQIAVECEGKSPSIRQLSKVEKTAKEQHALCTIVQPQFENKGALILASKLNLPVWNIDPLSEHYVNNLLDLANAIAKSQKPIKNHE